MKHSLLLMFALVLGACGGTEQRSEEPIVVNDDEEDEIQLSEGSEGATPDEGAACETDADCVPAGCCHPSECTTRANAPACDDVMCTQECRGGTLDCGGQCLCREGRCAAQFADVVQPPG